MTMDELKLKVAKEAFNYVENSIERDTIIGSVPARQLTFLLRS